MVDTSRRHGSIHCHTVGLLLIRKSDSQKSDPFFSNQFSQFSIKGPHQPGCFTLPSSTLVSAKEDSTQHGSFIKQFKQPEHTIINLRAGYSNKQWGVTGWVRNVTDKRVTMGGFAVAPLIYAVTTSPPRTFGIETNWKF